MNNNTNISNKTWYQSIDDLPRKYKMRLDEECIQVNDGKKFIVHDQIFYILKMFNDGENFSKEKKISQIGGFIQHNYKKIEKSQYNKTEITHSIFSFTPKKDYIRIINLNDLLSPEQILHKQIKKIFNEKEFTYLFDKINLMRAIQLDKKISKSIIEILEQKEVMVRLKANVIQLPEELPFCQKNICNEETLEIQKNALNKQIEILNSLKIDFNKFRVPGFIFYAQIIALLDTKKYKEEDLSRRTYLMNQILNSKISFLFSEPEKNKKSVRFIFCKNENLNKKISIFIFKNEKEIICPLVKQKMDELFGREHMDMILTKISKLPVCELSEKEIKTLSEMTAEQELSTSKSSPANTVEKIEKINPGKKHLSKNMEEKKQPKKRKVTPPIVLETVKGEGRTAPVVEILIFKDDKNNENFYAPCDSGNLILAVVGENLSPIKTIQYSWMEGDEKVGWEWAPELTSIKEESSALCLKIQLESGMLVPGNYLLKITCEDNQSVEMPFLAK